MSPAPLPSLHTDNHVGCATIGRREPRRVVRIWIQTIVPPAITMTLYFIIFGSLVGSRIGTMDGVPYMTFIAPGLIMMAVITNSFANVVSSFFSSKLMLHLEEMLVAPLSNVTIVIGYIAGGIVPRFGRFFARSQFRARFEEKGRFKPYLRAIPTYVVTADQPALTGLTRLLDQAG